MKNFTNTPSLPDGYVECNGQVLNDSGSVYNGQTIPNLNGSGGTKRFLRGSTSSGAVGGTSTHRHLVTGVECFSNVYGTQVVRSGTGVTVAAYNHGHALCLSMNSQYYSTLPHYYEVVWVMRIK